MPGGTPGSGTRVGSGAGLGNGEATGTGAVIGRVDPGRDVCGAGANGEHAASVKQMPTAQARMIIDLTVCETIA
jgi:hypothetical protein